MTTIINSPKDGGESNSIFGMVIGLIIFFAIAVIFIVYILPMIQNSQTPEDTNIKVDITTPLDETVTP